MIRPLIFYRLPAILFDKIYFYYIWSLQFKYFSLFNLRNKWNWIELISKSLLACEDEILNTTETLFDGKKCLLILSDINEKLILII